MSGPRIIVLHGPPASGKLTIARELAALTGLALFHNHLTVDLLLAVFPFGSPEFIAQREKIWLEVMTAAVRAGRSLIFTFNPEKTVRAEFVPALVEYVTAAAGRVDFVQITCPDPVIEQRLIAPSRSEYRKLNSLEFYRELRARGAFAFPDLPPARVVVDSSTLPPEQSAHQIAQHLGLAPFA